MSSPHYQRIIAENDKETYNIGNNAEYKTDYYGDVNDLYHFTGRDFKPKYHLCFRTKSTQDDRNQPMGNAQSVSDYSVPLI